MQITLNHVAEATALAASLIYWDKIKYTRLRWLPYFFLFILFLEFGGNYLQQMKNLNRLWYNIFIPVEYCFYFFLFWLHGLKKLKWFSMLSANLILLASLLSFICITPTFMVFYGPIPVVGIGFHSKMLMTGEILVVICCCLYLYEQFQEGEEESLLKNYFFWLCMGLLLFNLGEFAYTAFFPVISANNWDRFDSIFKAINNNLLLLLYLSYIISIIVCSKYVKQNAG